MRMIAAVAVFLLASGGIPAAPSSALPVMPADFVDEADLEISPDYTIDPTSCSDQIWMNNSRVAQFLTSLEIRPGDARWRTLRVANYCFNDDLWIGGSIENPRVFAGGTDEDVLLDPAGGVLEIRLGDSSGTLLGSLVVTSTVPSLTASSTVITGTVGQAISEITLSTTNFSSTPSINVSAGSFPAGIVQGATALSIIGTPSLAVSEHTATITATAGAQSASVTITFTFAAVLPGAPVLTGVSPGNGTAEATFTAPNSDGGDPSLSYEYSTDGGSTWVTPSPAVTASPIAISDLDNGTTYSVAVRALNSAGAGPASNSVPVSPAAPTTTTEATTTTTAAATNTTVAATTTTAAAETTSAVAVADDAPRLVTESNQEALTALAGEGVLFVGGQPVEVQIIQADEDLRRSIPGARTADQVAALRAIAEEVVAELRSILGDEAELPISVREVSTGAVIVGLVIDPVTGEIIEVPIEDVAFISGGGIALMVGGADGEGDPANIAFDGVLEFGEGGYVSILASGLTPGADGEVVVMSTPMLLDSFTVEGDGSVATQSKIPSDLEAGEHTVVVTVGDQSASLGFRVLPAGTLPSTGEDSRSFPWAVLVLAVGGLSLLTVTRRRSVG